MTTMPFDEQILTILICAIATMLTRFLPFLCFKPDSELPPYVKYLGKALPSAIFAMLVVYCLRDTSLLTGNHGIPEAIALVVTTLIHVWKRQMLLSMFLGTVCYMVLVQTIFQ